MNHRYRFLVLPAAWAFLSLPAPSQPVAPAPPAPAARPTLPASPLPPLEMDTPFAPEPPEFLEPPDFPPVALLGQFAMAPMPPLPASEFFLGFQDTPAAPAAPRAHISMARAAERPSDDRNYRRGAGYLDRREYDKALEAFNAAIEDKSPRADGATYWKAYTLNKLGRRDEALAALADLRKNFPNSRWLDDAKALDLEVRQGTGQAVRPEDASDEDLKLYALSGLSNTDPERAIPIIEKLLRSGNSPRLKERALFVLAQNRSPKTRDLLVQVAKGGYNPDLQAKAIEYLSMYGGKDNGQVLSDIYKSTNDLHVKRAILRSFLIGSNREALLAAAKSESNPELRMEAIRTLGAMGGGADLWQLYSSESNFEVKRAIISGLMISNSSDKLLDLAKTEKDPKLRRDAIEKLAVMGRTKSGASLESLYASETDPAIRKVIINGFFIQNNVPGMIAAARKETDPAVKKEIVQRLAMMHSKEATDYMLELLNK
ncbi:MAG: HEAT repeat domain-containing protein [Acidobacteriota bacterium]|nr:HEAT repeat domain-containing protein [Acidobacteriota bacterium]